MSLYRVLFLYRYKHPHLNYNCGGNRQAETHFLTLYSKQCCSGLEPQLQRLWLGNCSGISVLQPLRAHISCIVPSSQPFQTLWKPFSMPFFFYRAGSREDLKHGQQPKDREHLTTCHLFPTAQSEEVAAPCACTLTVMVSVLPAMMEKRKDTTWAGS